MKYKTIVLELIQERPELQEELRSSRTLLSTVNRTAAELKTSHEAWKEKLAQAKPDSDPTQIASTALELAIAELQESLPSAPAEPAEEPLSLDAAMNFIRRHTPTA